VVRPTRAIVPRLMVLAIASILVAAACSSAATTAPTAAPATAAPTAAPATAAPSGAVVPPPGVGSKTYKIGWADIYLTPTWMAQTQAAMEDEVKRLEALGQPIEFQVFNANGDTTQQIAQIQAMIDQKYDAIVVDAGSATALDPVIEQAVSQGIVVTNFDSLVSTDKAIRINTDTYTWGVETMEWLMQKIGGKGKIIAMNGPAGVSVSEDRWAGAKAVLDKNPDVQVVANVHVEYNLAPSQQACASALAANPDIVGIWSQGGAQSDGCLKAMLAANMKLVPMPGENFNGFLQDWSAQMPNGFSSFAVGQPTYLGAMGVTAAVYKLWGLDVAQYVNVPLPHITDATLGEYVPNDLPIDSYPAPYPPQAELDQLILTGGSAPLGPIPGQTPKPS
jgi:ribose transport system substrate-binding protein